MKIILLSFLLLISSSAFCQAQSWLKLDSSRVQSFFKEDTTIVYSTFSDKEIRFMYNYMVENDIECRLDNLSDSLIEFYAKYDAFYSVKDSVKKYYVIGHAGARPFDVAPKIALQKHNLILIYTHCSPCKYQTKYRDFFRKFYSERYGQSIDKLISEIEEEIMVERRKNYEKRFEERKKKESQDKN